jgi:hypothetical protein
MKKIPTEADWRSVPWCLDIPYAYAHFFGKSLPEAVALFEDNAIYYEEDLVFMPRPCLDYYIDAYIEYLMSERSKADSDGASCFFGLVQMRHDDINTFTSGTVARTKTVLRRLATHQAWYEAVPEIYGDFAKKAEQTLKLLADQS